MLTSKHSKRLVLCHLESLVCIPALQVIFDRLGDQIELVVLSRRFRGKHGGMIDQFVRGVRRSGWRMTVWLGFDIVAAQAASALCRQAPGRSYDSLLPVRALAALYGVRVVETTDINDAETIRSVAQARPDLVIVMNFDHILQPEFIGIARDGVLNLHPSLLPRYRGPCPAFWMLADEVRETGPTVHAIADARIDAGATLGQQAMTIDGSMSVAEVTCRLFLKGAGLLTQVLGGIEHRAWAAARMPPDSYLSFPSAQEVRRARARGVKLIDMRFLWKIFMAVTGRRSFEL